jgi:NAD(P)H-hydrate epimerase
LLKGPYTKIVDQTTKIIPVADFRLGVAGSGDILSGVIGGLLAKGLTTSEATTVGAWLHAHSAPKKNNGQASDILKILASEFHLFMENNKIQ